MIANDLPWALESPSDDDYDDFLEDRTMLFDTLPISDAAHFLLKRMFSPRPERRLSGCNSGGVLAVDRTSLITFKHYDHD